MNEGGFHFVTAMRLVAEAFREEEEEEFFVAEENAYAEMEEGYQDEEQEEADGNGCSSWDAGRCSPGSVGHAGASCVVVLSVRPGL